MRFPLIATASIAFLALTTAALYSATTITETWSIEVYSGRCKLVKSILGHPIKTSYRPYRWATYAVYQPGVSGEEYWIEEDGDVGEVLLGLSGLTSSSAIDWVLPNSFGMLNPSGQPLDMDARKELTVRTLRVLRDNGIDAAGSYLAKVYELMLASKKPLQIKDLPSVAEFLQSGNVNADWTYYWMEG